MIIELVDATHEDIPVLRRLMQFYLYDIASLDHWDMRADGTYGNPQRIETLWNEKEYNRFLIRVDGILAGFALTSETRGGENESIHVVNEFFVLRRYRRSGVGRIIARRLFDGFDGPWRLSIMRSNSPALDFWSAVVADYTGREPREFITSKDTDEDIVFHFRTA